MASLALTLTTSCKALSGGGAAVAGTGSDTILTVSNLGGGDWITGDSFTITFTDATSAVQTQVGFGNLSGQQATFALTFNDKIYLLCGTVCYFPELTRPTVFNDLNTEGNSFIQLGNQSGTPENQVAIAEFQGNLAFIARRTTQIFAIDPDPLQNAKQQTMRNIGTFAALSVQSIGDREVLMLADSGVRSLRPRVASQNAEPVDIGTPIDALIQAALVTLTEAEKAAACAIIEPSANRYLLYVPGHAGAVGSIYVLSSFPGSEIEAWTTYSPTYQVAVANPAANYTASTVTYTGLTIGATYAWKPGAHETRLVNGANTYLSQNIFVATATTAVVTGTGATVTFTGALSLTTSFTPSKFTSYLGQVYCRAGDNVFVYGGLDNNTYDACGPSLQVPYLDCDTPSLQKYFHGVDVGIQGTWQVGFSGNYNGGSYKNVYNNSLASFQLGNIPLGGRLATHFSLSFTEVGDAAARLSNAIVHFEPGAPKK